MATPAQRHKYAVLQDRCSRWPLPAGGRAWVDRLVDSCWNPIVRFHNDYCSLDDFITDDLGLWSIFNHLNKNCETVSGVSNADVEGWHGQKMITIKSFVSVDIDAYHDKCQIFVSFKFQGRFLLLSERHQSWVFWTTRCCENTTKTCQTGEHFTSLRKNIQNI